MARALAENIISCLQKVHNEMMVASLEHQNANEDIQA
jgi:hypothetical protein